MRMEVCGVGSTTRGYWRQGASDLEEVKPDNIDYLTGSTLSWKKAHLVKDPEYRIAEQMTFSALLPFALLMSLLLGLGAR